MCLEVVGKDFLVRMSFDIGHRGNFLLTCENIKNGEKVDDHFFNVGFCWFWLKIILGK